MENTKKNDELFDDELMRLMGDQYTDRTLETVKPAAESVEEAEGTTPAVWKPVFKRTQIERVAAAAKWALTFGGLFGLFYYWQQTGLMDPAAAVPCMCVCALLVGWGTGKNLNK